MEDPRILEDGPHGYVSSRERTYQDFLKDKIITAPRVGFEPVDLLDALYGFQRTITEWACLRGRAAIFADCGLGKTPMQLEWARQVVNHAQNRGGGCVLIVAPLAVSDQTVREGDKFGISVNLCRTGDDVNQPGINITNYERLHHFDPAAFDGIVLDESSILKAYDGKRKGEIIDFAQTIPYRLACTATPAPNDYTELCNHAEFLDIMREKEVKALFFTQDGNTTTEWRIKGHAREDFWRWMASWAIAIRKPSDLGFDDDGFILPPLLFHHTFSDVDFNPSDELFAREAQTLTEQRAVARASMDERVSLAAQQINASTDPWLVWCNLNDESSSLARAIDGAVEVKGSDPPGKKTDALMGFAEGRYRVLVTKPRIAGFGMNFQHCAHMAFVGLSHSYEQLYQATRRCWRFGQTRTVHVHVIDDVANRRIVKNIEQKERRATRMMEEIVRHMSEAGQGGAFRQEAPYVRDVARGQAWQIDLGDCVEITHDLDDASVGLSVFSPPFPGMYVYSNSERDMGNTASIEDMIEHMRYMVRPLLRKTMPGRSACIHLTQSTAQKVRDGYIGLRDFRGAVIRLMESEGWIYYGEVTIDKNPQLKAIRTKDRGLLFKTLAKDASHMHMALADYLLQFRRPGDNPEPIQAGISQRYDNAGGWITAEEWIRWARPVWYAADWLPPATMIVDATGDAFFEYDGIAETDVLNVAQARETNDERHLAPLQLGVIRRAVKLWSNPGDIVYSPYAGIGSEGHEAVLLKRRFRGAELKNSYFASAVRNLKAAEQRLMQGTLFQSVD